MDYFLDCLFTKAYSEGNNLIIEGYASTEDVDSVGDIVLTSSAKFAIEKMMSKYMENPVLLFQHGKDKEYGYRSVGHIADYKIDSKGLWVKAVMSSADDVKPLVTRAIEKDLRAFSIGFVKKQAMKLKDGTTVITDWQLKEISIVSIPCNENTLFNVAKNFELNENEIKNQKEISKMTEFNEKLQEKFNQLYMDHADMKARNSMLEREKQILEDVIAKKSYKSTEEKNDIEQTLKNWNAEKDELKTKMEELQTELKEYKEKGLSFIPNSPATKESEVVNKAFDIAVFEAKRIPFEEMEARFQMKMLEGDNTRRGKDSFEYTDVDVVKSYLADSGVQFDPNNVKHQEFVEKAITTSTGIMAETMVDYNPIAMADSRTPLLNLIPKKMMSSKDYKWYQETGLPTSAFDADGFTPTLTDPTFVAKTSTLKIQYCGTQVNDFAEKVAGVSMLAVANRAVDKSLDFSSEWALIHGNATADTNCFNGITYYVNGSSAQFVDKNGTAVTIKIVNDLVGKFMENVASNSSDGKRPNVLLVDTRMFTAWKNLLESKFTGTAITSTITVGGIVYNAIMHDNLMILESDSLRDYTHTAPTFSASAVAGGTLVDDEYFVRVSAVTKNGESTAGTETSATTSGSNNTVRLAVTKQTGDLYYKVYMGLTTGHTNLVWIQTVARSAGAGTQNIDVSAPPSYKYEKCLDDANNTKILAIKVGGESGYEMGFNERKTFVKLAKTGNHERFYKRNYETAQLKNENCVAELLVDLA
jgi:HK97 family phage prohead protease